MLNRSTFLEFLPPIVKNLLIINVLFWFADIILSSRGIEISYFLGLRYWQSDGFNPAQGITYMFLHANFFHLFFNMFGLVMFGRVLEVVLGPKRFLFYYIVTGIGAALIQQFAWAYELQPYQYDMAVTVGASGAIFGLLIAFAMYFPNESVYLMFIPIPIKAKYFVIIYGIIELTSGVRMSAGDNIAHFAHVGGMLVGFIIIQFWRKNNFRRN